MPVQTSYDQEYEKSFPGGRVDLGNFIDIISKNVEGSAIGYGLGVVLGTADDQCILPSTATGTFLGVTERTLDGVANSDNESEYARYTSANIIRTGRVWVECEDGCVFGDRVFMRYTAGATESLGAFRTDDDSGDAVEIPGARWESTATAGNIAVLKLPDTVARSADLSTTETLLASGVVSIYTDVTLIDSTAGAQTLTLANGVRLGQVKVIKMTVDNGDAVVTPVSFGDGTTLTFDTAFDVTMLMWDGTAWQVLSNSGAVIA